MHVRQGRMHEEPGVSMNYKDVAARVLTAIGGAGNVEDVATCLTRLRLTLADADAVDMEGLRGIPGVLGIATQGADRLEVVFGPAAIEGVAREFAIQSEVALGGAKSSCVNPIVEGGAAPATRPKADAPRAQTATRSPRAATLANDPGAVRIEIPAGRKRSYRAQQRAAIEDERLSGDDIDALRAFLAEDEQQDDHEHAHVSVSSEVAMSLGHSLLVINGPNINMLGTREPDIYGRQDYPTLVSLCKDAGHKAGFVDVRCFQSNHEGDIVDEIQAALGTFDGIVINPAAYTHTSVAILDALKAVALPCVEVHISKVDEREGFRQVSYVREACFETVVGMGLEGYRKAINDLAQHLGM